MTLSPELKQSLRADVNAGLTINQIAKKHGAGYNTTLCRLRICGLQIKVKEKRGPRYQNTDRDKSIVDASATTSPAQIACDFNISRERGRLDCWLQKPQ